MGIRSDPYNVVLLIHILSVVVGIGALTLNGVYALEAKNRQGREGLAIAEANAKVTKIAEYVILTIPLWGFGLLGMSDGVYEFSQTWIWLSFLLWMVAVGIAQAVLLPADRRIRSLMGELVASPPAGGSGPPPQVAEIEALGKKAGAMGGLLNLLLVVIIALMVWKPGI